MKKTVLILTILSLSLSACDAMRTTAAAESTKDLPDSQVSSLVPPSLPATPYPSATFIAIPTPTPTAFPTKIAPSSPAADCNIAELVAQGLQKEVQQSEDETAAFSLLLHFTNAGSCTWTTGYTIILVQNEGLEIEARQNFVTHAVPGDTVEIPISLAIPQQDGTYKAIWLIEDPNGDIFGTGPNRDQLVILDAIIADGDMAITVNNWLFPSEQCAGQPREFTLPSFARLMHDPQWMPWPSRMQDPGWNSHFHYDWYPETVPLWTNPAGGDGRLPYSREWLEYLRAIQPNDEAAVWIARVAAGLFNKGNDFIPILELNKLREEPVAEGISSGGNVVRLMEFRNGATRIQMLYFKDDVPSPNVVNYFNTPWLVTKFTSVSIDGELGNAGGIDVYFPNLAKQSEGYWVDINRIEFFPVLPICVTVEEQLNVYAEPDEDAAILGSLAPSQEILIRDYLPQGSDVWGRFSDGWVQLVFQRKGKPIYPTTWEMGTRPPIYFD